MDHEMSHRGTSQAWGNSRGTGRSEILDQRQALANASPQVTTLQRRQHLLNQSSRVVSQQRTNEQIAQAMRKSQAATPASRPLQRVSAYTNSLGETHDVYTKTEVMTEVTQPFKDWKAGTKTTSGHSASQAKKVKASEWNRISVAWNRKNDKTTYDGEKRAIAFTTGGSLSGGKGVKHLKGVSTFGSSFQRRSFVWHVRHIPD